MRESFGYSRNDHIVGSVIIQARSHEITIYEVSGCSAMKYPAYGPLFLLSPRNVSAVIAVNPLSAYSYPLRPSWFYATQTRTFKAESPTSFRERGLASQMPSTIEDIKMSGHANEASSIHSLCYGNLPTVFRAFFTMAAVL